MTTRKVVGTMALLVALLAIGPGTIFTPGRSGSAGEKRSRPSATSEGAGATARQDTTTDKIGAEANPTGSPIGGGPGYQSAILAADADYIVTNADELIAALAVAGSGEIVYVADTSSLNLTGMREISIPAGVTLASGRGENGSTGALLYSDAHDTSPLFQAAGPSVRVTGLRIRGPDPNIYSCSNTPYCLPTSAGVRCDKHSNFEVDNCEIWAWSHAAVRVTSTPDAHVHHNYIHHNRRDGLGYGVVVTGQDCMVLIEANEFDANRHSIAGTGEPRQSYQASYNMVGPIANAHAFDMHGYFENGGYPPLAGEQMIIDHNTFLIVAHEAVVIRGIPRKGAFITRNEFALLSAGNAVSQVNYTGRVFVWRNSYGGNPPEE